MINEEKLFTTINSTNNLIQEIEKNQSSRKRKLFVKNIIKKIRSFFKEKIFKRKK